MSRWFDRSSSCDESVHRRPAVPSDRYRHHFLPARLIGSAHVSYRMVLLFLVRRRRTDQQPLIDDRDLFDRHRDQLVCSSSQSVYECVSEKAAMRLFAA